MRNGVFGYVKIRFFYDFQVNGIKLETGKRDRPNVKRKLGVNCRRNITGVSYKIRKMKKIYLLLFLFSASILTAQEIELEDGVLYLDDKACLKINSLGMNSYEIISLDGKNSVIVKTFTTQKKYVPEFQTKLFFIGPDEAATFSAKGMYSKKTIAALLIRSGVVDPENCTFHWDKLERLRILFNEEE